MVDALVEPLLPSGHPAAQPRDTRTLLGIFIGEIIAQMRFRLRDASSGMLVGRLGAALASASANDLRHTAEEGGTGGGNYLHAVVARSTRSLDARIDAENVKRVCVMLINAGAAPGEADDRGLTPADIASFTPGKHSKELKRWLLSQEQGRKFVDVSHALRPELLEKASTMVDGRKLRRGTSHWRVRVEVRAASLVRELTDPELISVFEINCKFCTQRRAPVGELLDLWVSSCLAEATASGRPVGHGRLDFRLDGARLDGTEQLSTLGLTTAALPLSEASVIECHDKEEHAEERAAALASLNALAAQAERLFVGAPEPEQPQAAAAPPAVAAALPAAAAAAEKAPATSCLEPLDMSALDADTLDTLLSNLDAPSLLALARTSKRWLWACLRSCLLRQLHSGELELHQVRHQAGGALELGRGAPETARTYAEWLSLLERSEFALALGSCSAAAAHGHPRGTLCKLDGDGSDPFFEKFEPLQCVYPPRHCRWARHMRMNRGTFRGRYDHEEAKRAAKGALAEQRERWALAGMRALPEAGVIREALDDAEVGTALRLFSRYFATGLADLLPLVVCRQAALGFDFTSTQTWVVYAPPCAKASQGARAATIAGAIAWRMHTPPAGSSLRPVAEVLFLAIDPDARHSEAGRSLVRELGAAASAAGHGEEPLLYVEVARHEKVPKVFWTSHGFGNASGLPEGVLSGEQRAFVDARCWRFNDTQQYVRCGRYGAGAGAGGAAEREVEAAVAAGYVG